MAGYKINTQRPVGFLYINNEQSEKEIKKTVSFKIASRRKKYSLNNYSRRWKTYTPKTISFAEKKLKTNNWKGICVHGLKDFYAVDTTQSNL